MKKNILNAQIFPFAFNPENPFSRNAEWIDDKTLSISFDMTIGENPECAAIALLLPSNNTITTLTFIAKTKSKIIPNIMIELKKGIQKIRYCEEKLKFDSETSLKLDHETSEILFPCWRAVNKDFKGEIIISFE